MCAGSLGYQLRACTEYCFVEQNSCKSEVPIEGFRVKIYSLNKKIDWIRSIQYNQSSSWIRSIQKLVEQSRYWNGSINK